MSYNIDECRYLNGTLYMSAPRRRELAYRFRPELPEGCFLTDAVAVDGDKIVRPWWYGEGSSRSWGVLLRVLANTTGRADLLFVWEGGDDFTGLRVRNGVVTEHEVGFKLLD